MMTKFRMKPQPVVLEEAIMMPTPMKAFSATLKAYADEGLTMLYFGGPLAGCIAPGQPSPDAVPVKHGEFWYWEIPNP